MASTEELQRIVEGLVSVAKGLTQNVNHISTRIGQLATTSQQAPSIAPTASPAQPPQSSVPVICCHGLTQDIADFLQCFQQQTSHLPADITVTLLEQQCVGEWSCSVLSIAKTTADFAEKPTTEQLTTFIEHLKYEFEEPTTIKRCQLAVDLSSMTQKAGENMNQFTFQFRNILHQMERLGKMWPKTALLTSFHNF